LFSRLFRWRPAVGASADTLYQSVVAQARTPGFYADLGVPDTVDGRFDMVVLHVFLVLRRLKGQGEAAEALSRMLVERMVKDMDLSLREMGTGDTGVGRRVETMVSGLYGRINAYDAALASGEARPLRAALDRNLYGTVLEASPEHLDRMAGYMRREAASLERQSVENLMAGTVRFGAPPGGDEF